MSTTQVVLCLVLVATTFANMLDLIDIEALPPPSCAHGCAAWASLSKDGNTRNQTEVNAKWSNDVAPEDAGRYCAAPSNDPGTDGAWCYCRQSGDSSWASCQSPVAVPRQVNLQIGGASTVVASFVTFEANCGDSPVAEWAADGSVHDVSAAGSSRVYQETGSEKRLYCMHFVELGPLAPRTAYHFRVASHSNATWSRVYHFRSLYNDNTEPTRFAVFGDMGIYATNNIGNLARDVASGAIDFVVHLGDHAYNLGEDDGRRGDGYFTGIEPVVTAVPWLTVMGNHEYYDGDVFTRYLNQTYGNKMVNAVLSNSGTNRFYSTDIGMAHLVVLDFNIYYFDTEESWRLAQLEWLQLDLAAASQRREATPWIIVMAHMPLYCSSVTLDTVYPAGVDPNTLTDFQGCVGTGEANVERSRKDVEPLLLEYGVDLFLCGHEHNYESLYPTMNNTKAGDDFSEPKAPVHVVTGAGGPAGLDRFGPPGPWTRKQLSNFSYSRISIVDAATLEFEQISNADNTVLDQWTLTQTSHGPFV